MSAYICNNQHIGYIVAAIHQWDVSWYYNATCHYAGNHAKALSNSEIGSILLSENVRGVNARYHETAKPAPFPGHLVPHVQNLDPVQVIKACRCLMYQCAETSDWEDSHAHCILQALITYGCYKLPGYDDAVYGAPPYPGGGRLDGTASTM